MTHNGSSPLTLQWVRFGMRDYYLEQLQVRARCSVIYSHGIAVDTSASDIIEDRQYKPCHSCGLALVYSEFKQQHGH